MLCLTALSAKPARTLCVTIIVAMQFHRAAFRFIAAAIMLAGAWGLQLFLSAIVLRNAGPTGLLAWAQYSGIYCLFALVLVGAPVAVLKPSAYMEDRPRAILLVGMAGAIMAMLPPSGALFVVTVPLGFLSGAGAMWAYLTVVSEYPDRFGISKPRRREGGGWRVR